MNKLKFEKITCPFCNSINARLYHEDPHRSHSHNLHKEVRRNAKCPDCNEEWTVVQRLRNH